MSKEFHPWQMAQTEKELKSVSNTKHKKEHTHRFCMPKLRVRLLPLMFSIILLVIFGTMFYSYFEEWSIVDSLYFTVMTLSTVGYGDLYPTYPLTKMFTVFYVLFGVYLMFYALRIFTTYYIEKKTPNVKRAVTQTLEHMVHKKKSNNSVVIQVPPEKK